MVTQLQLMTCVINTYDTRQATLNGLETLGRNERKVTPLTYISISKVGDFVVFLYIY
jgi:hypothetical protein